MMTSSRPRCASHGLLLDDAGGCCRCSTELPAEGGRDLGSRLGIVAACGVLLLVLFRLVGFGVGMLSSARSGGDSTTAPASITASSSRVVVYTTSSCPACRMAKSWMNAHAVAYDERLVDSDTNARRELAGLNHAGSVPTFVVDGGQVLVGFDAQGVRLTRALEKRVATP